MPPRGGGRVGDLWVRGTRCVCVGSEDLIFKIETASPEGGLLKEDHTNDLRAQSNNCGVNNSITQVFGNNPPSRCKLFWEVVGIFLYL